MAHWKPWARTSWKCRNLRHAACRGQWRTARAAWKQCACLCHRGENGEVLRYVIGPHGERVLVDQELVAAGSQREWTR
jgi:hypothetical protein